MSKRNRLMSTDRRMFLKTVSLAGLSGLLLPRHLQAETQANSRVITIEDAAATSGNSINSSVVQTMITSGIKSLAQNNDEGEAWKLLLPGVTSTSKIALKLNCFMALSTHPAVTLAVANSLKQMMFGAVPFPENNIIIYDNDSWYLINNGGYTINTGSTGVRCMGTSSYSTTTYDIGGVQQRLSTIVTDTVDFLINIPVLKNHSMAGVSLCLKNHYGTCNSPNTIHGTNSLCDPYIPALNATTPIATKQKVFIIDALYGIRSGGPSGTPQFTANKIIMSTDIVATDYCGRKLLADNGCLTTARATHIDTAATTYDLGTNNPDNMDLITITNPSTGVSKDESSIPRETKLYENYPNPFNPMTHIQYEVAQPGHVALKVYDTSGKEITTLFNGFLRSGTYHATFKGHDLSSGTYIYRLQTANAMLSRKMVLTK